MKGSPNEDLEQNEEGKLISGIEVRTSDRKHYVHADAKTEQGNIVARRTRERPLRCDYEVVFSSDTKGE